VQLEWTHKYIPVIGPRVPDMGSERRFLDLVVRQSQTPFMPHIYLLFDFAKDEEKAQQARHKLENWKQAFRLDKKLLYRMERISSATAGDGDAAAKPSAEDKAEKPAKGEKGGKGKGKAKATRPEPETAPPSDDIKLLIRLAFSNHEKLSEQRWVQRIPTEEPFQAASPKVVKSGEAEFEATEKRFDELD
jgi:hypothetical protein